MLDFIFKFSNVSSILLTLLTTHNHGSNFLLKHVVSILSFSCLIIQVMSFKKKKKKKSNNDVIHATLSVAISVVARNWIEELVFSCSKRANTTLSLSLSLSKQKLKLYYGYLRLGERLELNLYVLRVSPKFLLMLLYSFAKVSPRELSACAI